MSLRPWLVGFLGFLAALALVLPGLGSSGFWSEGELPVLWRSTAALGEPHSDLVRSPWLPDFVRTQSYRLLDAFDPELALRLPHAFAVAALAGMAAGLARQWGASVSTALLAAGLVLAFPGNAMASRTALGNPMAEASIAGAIVMGCLATTVRPAAHRWLVAAGALLLLAAAVASAGLLLGATVPLLAVAAYVDATRPRLRSFVLLAAGVMAGISVMLIVRQQEGFVPILAAAKDLELLEKPYAWRFLAGVEQWGHQTFPWLPLAVLGALHPQKRWPGRWLMLGLVVFGGWTAIYGPGSVPLSVPTALCCALAVERLGQRDFTPSSRRLAFLVLVLGTALLGKDASRLPLEIGLPLLDAPRTAGLDALDIGEDLARSWKLAALTLLAAGMLAPWLRKRGRVGHWLPALVVGAAVLFQAGYQSHVTLPRAGTLLSPAATLDRFAHWSNAGLLPAKLAIYGVEDPGLARYGPGPSRQVLLGNSQQLLDHLAAPEPAAALVRDIDLPRLHQRHRRDEWPLYVLDDSHGRLLLVSNRLPPGARNRNPIEEVVLSTPPRLEHETLVRFEDRLELVGWQFDEPVIRGTEGTLTMVFRVLRPLPGRPKLVARLQKGKVSRVNAQPHEFVQGIYPPVYWRPGDYIVHRQRFDVPALEILPGTHEVIVAVKHGKNRDYEITIPSEEDGDFGVRIKNRRRSYAAIGTAEVW